MGSLGPELSLDIKTTFVPKTIGDLVKELSLIGDFREKVSKLDGLVGGLEEEMKKIDAFKRELPLCMLLLNDAIELLKEEKKKQFVVSYEQPVLEEFIPLKKISVKEEEEVEEGDSLEPKEEESKDKKNWMSSVQLWNINENPTDHNYSFDQDPTLKIEPKITNPAEASQCANESVFQACKSRNEAKAFLPFKSCPGLTRKEDSKREEMPIPGFCLLAPGMKQLREKPGRGGCSRVASSSAPHSQWHLRSGPQSIHEQPGRKQRRCWSPDLHRRFINALQQLGDCYVATPKQIRELMQVDGLTNDEVKSHLQKYRLHMRRVPPSPAPANQSDVVLGGLWGSEQYSDSSKATSSQSGSPQGPLQLTGTTGGDSMEDDEDAKSEVYIQKRPGKR